MMRSFILRTAVCIIIHSTVFAQPSWEMNYGGTGIDYGRSVQQTTDGGYIVAGYTNSFGNGYQVYLIKINASGDTLWTRTYGGADDDRGYSVQQTTDSGYIIAGSTSSFGNGSQVYLIKTNANGETLWSKTYGGPGDDAGNSVQQTLDGGYVVAGTLGDTISWMYLIKTNASGDTIWSLRYRTIPSEYNIGYSVQQTSDTGYIFSGEQRINPDLGGGLLIKTDAFGDTLWVKEIGSGFSIQQTIDGGYIIGGYWPIPMPPYHLNALYKTNSSGEVIWMNTFGRYRWEGFGYSVQQTRDGGYILNGVIADSVNSWQVYLVKTDTIGLIGVEESPIASVRTPNSVATIFHNLLYLPIASSVEHKESSVLFDITGRKVANLKAGANDIRHIAPGVYFIRNNNNNLVTKIIVTR